MYQKNFKKNYASILQITETMSESSENQKTEQKIFLKA